MIQFSKDGVNFRYHGDVITRRWPWVNGARYSSSLHALDFNDFPEYWRVIGALEAELRQQGTDKMQGLHTYELITDYARCRFPGEHIVVLCDIRPEARDHKFWGRIPAHQAKKLLSDFAIFHCKDRSQMVELVLGTPTFFATAYGIDKGILTECNLWTD